MEIITGYVGKPHVTAEQDRDINQGIIGSGSYVLQTGMGMAAEVSSNNEVKIRDGVIIHQGCAASIKKNAYDPLTIMNGSQGMKRIDLIVARYERNNDTRVESMKLIVLQGTPDESSPTVPKYATGDIQAGDIVADMPMYQVIIDGLNITEVKKVFETAPDISTMKKEISELNSKIDYTFSSIAWTNPTYDLIEKAGIVYLSYYVIVSDGVAGYAYVVATLPNALKPRKRIRGSAWCASQDGTRHPGNYDINTDGVIKFVAGGPFIEVGFSVCYPI